METEAHSQMLIGSQEAVLKLHPRAKDLSENHWSSRRERLQVLARA